MTETAPLSWKQRFAAARGPEYWAANTRILMRDARTYRGEQLQQRLKHFAFWAEYSAKNPQAADAGLLAEFVEDLSRLAGNYGTIGETDIATALDYAIALCQRNGDSTTRLHLAKARYLATLLLEGDEREDALRAARPSTACAMRAATSRFGLPRLLIDIARTLRGGELGRNNTFRLLTKLPVVLGSSDQAGVAPCPHREGRRRADGRLLLPVALASKHLADAPSRSPVTSGLRVTRRISA